MDTQIRPLAGEDVEGVLTILLALAREEGRPPIDRPATRRLLEAYLGSPDRHAFVAVGDDGRVAGYVTVHWIPFPLLGGLEGYVSDLVVSGEGRGLGLGSRLLGVVEDEARRRGCARLMLHNRVGSASYERAFYLKRGFRRRDEFAGFVKELGEAEWPPRDR